MTVKLVVFISDTATARGGATALALLSAELLRAKGLNVTFITGDDGDNADLTALGVEIIAAKGQELLRRRPLKSAVEGIHNHQTRNLIAEFIATRDTSDSIYHVHGWGQILSPSIFAALRKVASRTVIHCHDFFLACPNGVFFDFQKEQDCTRKPLGLSCALTNCDKRSYVHKGWRLARHGVFRRLFDQKLPWGAVVLIHPDMRPQMELADYPANRLLTMRNPALRFSESRIKAEKNKGFVFVGRIEPDKGIVELVNAATKAGVPLTVIGDGPLRASLATSHPEFDFPGWKTRAEIGALIQNCRALVMPPRFREPFGLVAVEASQSGLPVILPNSALLAPEITSNGLGFACNIRNIQQFTETLAQVAALPDAEIRAISERGYAGDIELGLTPENWVTALIAVYDRLVGKAAWECRSSPAHFWRLQ